MPSRKVLLLSSSKIYGQEMYAWCTSFLKSFLEKNNVKNILFVPYAAKNCDEYFQLFVKHAEKLGCALESIHNAPDPVKAVEKSEAIFVGGGNTFLLLKRMYENNLLEPIRNAVFKRGVLYIGSSAGTNVATKSINTTNDMPICYPPSFDALQLVSFNINPHYIEPETNSRHMGETREQRITEYLDMLDAGFVLGLKEGCALLVEDDKATLMGCANAKLFQKDKEAVEFKPGDDVSFLLKEE